MDDGHTLADYNAGDTSTVHLVPRSMGWGTSGLNVFVQTITGDTIELVVKSANTVAAVKEMIQERIGIPAA